MPLSFVPLKEDATISSCSAKLKHTDSLVQVDSTVYEVSNGNKWLNTFIR